MRQVGGVNVCTDALLTASLQVLSNCRTLRQLTVEIFNELQSMVFTVS